MALNKILRSAPETPYSRPPPIHILALISKTEKRVLSWSFEDGAVRPLVSKENVVVIFSDGDSLTKVTLFEEFASKIKCGYSYIMRGYTLRGQAPPYSINVNKDTQFFRSAPLEVADALREEAEKLLCPTSVTTEIVEAVRAEGLLTVQGEVVKVSAIKRVQVGRETVPLKTMSLEQDKHQVEVSLWREAAMFAVQLGQQARLTHLKGNKTSYGFRLQSTSYTALEDTVTTAVVSALGATEFGKPGYLQLLVEDGDAVYEIEEALWAPLEKLLLKLPFYLKIKTSGKVIVEAEACQKEE